MFNSNKILTIDNIADMYLDYCRDKNINSVYDHDNLFRTFLIEKNVSIPIELSEKINIKSLNEWCDIYLKKN